MPCKKQKGRPGTRPVMGEPGQRNRFAVPMIRGTVPRNQGMEPWYPGTATKGMVPRHEAAMSHDPVPRHGNGRVRGLVPRHQTGMDRDKVPWHETGMTRGRVPTRVTTRFPDTGTAGIEAWYPGTWVWNPGTEGPT